MTAAIAAARQRIAASIDASAVKAIAELRAISIRNNRSMGQIVRHRVTEARRIGV